MIICELLGVPVEQRARMKAWSLAAAAALDSLVIPILGAANRAPDEFEDPDRLDLQRCENPHLSFGRGIHFCLGAPLPRLEAQIAIDALLRRFPALALGPGQPRFRPTMTLRGMRALPLTF